MEIQTGLLLIVKSAHLGDSEPDLGATLIKSFLTMLWESGKLPARIAFFASGVFLTTEGSPVREILENFAASGTEILSCGTCLEYYGRKEKLLIGQPTTMRDTVNALLTFEKVIYA
jgi:selenium metabolism protein YedF